MKISNLEKINRVEFVRLFEDEMSDLGYRIADRNFGEFDDYFLEKYQEE